MNYGFIWIVIFQVNADTISSILSQLLEVLPACEEQQFLGRMLGVNKGLRTDDFEEYKWIRSFEVFVNKRLQKTDIDEPFDFLLFVSDEEYRKNFFIAGHRTATGYRLTALMVESYIDYIIRNNPEDFKQVSFIGTPYYYEK